MRAIGAAVPRGLAQWFATSNSWLPVVHRAAIAHA